MESIQRLYTRALSALATCAITLVVLLSQFSLSPAGAASPLQLAPAPPISIQASSVVSGDISAGVRVERRGRSFDVWLLTPQSVYWDADAVWRPTTQQLAAMRQLGRTRHRSTRMTRLVAPKLQARQAVSLGAGCSLARLIG